MADLVFTERRRDLVAKTLADLLKIAVAAALASKLFIEFPAPARLALATVTPLLLVAAFLICPKNGQKERTE